MILANTGVRHSAAGATDSVWLSQLAPGIRLVSNSSEEMSRQCVRIKRKIRADEQGCKCNFTALQTTPRQAGLEAVF